MNKFLRSALWGIGLVSALTSMSSSAIVMEDFTAIAYGDDPYTGNTYAGTLTYDETVLTSVGAETLNPGFGSVTVDFTFEGQVFDETNDIDYSDFPALEFFDGVLLAMDYVLMDGVDGVDFTDPTVLSVWIQSDLYPVVGASGYTADAYVEVDVVPEPTTLALLGLGFAGIGFARRRS